MVRQFRPIRPHVRLNQIRKSMTPSQIRQKFSGVSGRLPLVSVILPVFNGAATVEQAILSLGMLQDLDVEIVVVDDGSTDNTLDVLEQLRPKLRGVPFRIIQAEHGGVAAASNTAIEAARGQWIARIDADDWSSPHRLRQQLQYAEKHDLDGVSCLVKIVTPDGHPAQTLQEYEGWLNSCVSPEEISAMRFVELPVPNPTMMAKREIFEMQYRAGTFPEDYDLWLRALGAGWRIGKVPRTLYWWTDHEDRVTRTQAIYSRAAFLNAKKMHLPDGPLRGVTHCDFWGAGLEGKPWIRWLQQRGIKIRHIIEVNPRKIGSEIHGVPVISPERICTTPSLPLFIGVGVPKGRQNIQEYIHGHLPHTPGEDAWFLA
jgi:glycosyltransferase involved in cell wall biosynthesis